jgi:putative membrane protein
MMWHMGNGWGWWMAFGWLWMVIFWGLIIWAVYAVITRVERRSSDNQPPRETGTALDILERRYARGDIDAEQFEEMRRRITGGGGPFAKSA